MSKKLMTIIYVSGYTFCLLSLFTVVYFGAKGELETALNYLIWVAVAFLVGNSFQSKVEDLTQH